MKLKYKTAKVERLCTKLSEARKLLGNREAKGLMALVNLIISARNLNDVKVFSKYRVHPLENKNHNNRKGQVSCSIPSSSYRLIMIPIDENGIEWNGEDEFGMYKDFEVVEVREVVDYHG